MLDAWDCGNAQKRERLITIGVRKDLADKIKINFPTPQEYKHVLRDVLKNVPESLGAKYSDYKKIYLNLYHRAEIGEIS